MQPAGSVCQRFPPRVLPFLKFVLLKLLARQNVTGVTELSVFNNRSTTAATTIFGGKTGAYFPPVLDGVIGFWPQSSNSCPSLSVLMWIAMAIILTPSPRPRSHTQLPLPTGPNTAMFLGQGVGQWGGRWEPGGGVGGGQKEDETERLRDFKSRQGSVSTQREQRVALTTGGMSFPLISCNWNGVIRGWGGCCRSRRETPEVSPCSGLVIQVMHLSHYLATTHDTAGVT